jgi:hypothetical protein
MMAIMVDGVVLEALSVTSGTAFCARVWCIDIVDTRVGG